MKTPAKNIADFKKKIAIAKKDRLAHPKKPWKQCLKDAFAK